MRVGIIQARMGSSRLPGKMMLPLAGTPTITHVVRRVQRASTLDAVVVATSEGTQDDILGLYADRTGADVHRGSEMDVLGRMFDAASKYDPSVVVRLTGDCPLLPPECIDAVVSALERTGAAYASTVLERTFPRGFAAEAFTFSSFEYVEEHAQEPYQREHVTPYYRTDGGEFETVSVTSDAVFDDPRYRDRTDLRLTLDEAFDYELLDRIYEGVAFDGILPARAAIDYVDEEGLGSVNAGVEQRTLDDITE
jgi:spore coat polysaccharide biosynthesis protein SpsF